MTPVVAIVAAVFAVLELVFVVRWWRTRRVVALIEATPTTRIRDVTTGTVEIEGDAVAPSEPIRSPWSDKPCCHYHLKVEEYRGGKHARWVAIVEERTEAPIVVADASGRIAVDVARARVHLRADHHLETSVFTNPDPRLEDLLQRHGRSARNWFGFGKRIRLTETVIEPGDRLYVLGHAEPDVDPPWVIGKGGPAFLVSDQPEHEVVHLLRREGLMYGILAFATLAFGGVTLWAVRPR